MKTLNGIRVAILVENGFEQVELTSPRDALRAASAEPVIVSPQKPVVRGWNHVEWGEEFPVDLQLDEARAEDFDALVLPGGQMNPDFLRTNLKVLKFVRGFFEQDKPVAAICHGPWTLINAGVVKGKKMTSYHTIRLDLENAGANWHDAKVIEDGNLITSRNPDDLPAFNEALIEKLSAVSV
jgi:protease I